MTYATKEISEAFICHAFLLEHMCAMVKSRYIGDGHPTFNRNPYNWYIKPDCWVDDRESPIRWKQWEFRP